MAPTGVFFHYYSQQTGSTSRFSLHITVRFGNKAQNANFSAKEQHQKLHIYRQFLIQILYLFKNKKSTFTANLKVRPWYLTGSFPLNVFRGIYISHFIRPSLAYLKLPLSRPKRILGNPAKARAENSPTFHFIDVSSHPVLPAKYRIH